MRKMLLSIMAVTFLSPLVSLKSAEKPTIAVMPFVINESVLITIRNQRLVPTVIETRFASKLMEFLVNSRKFDVLERDYLVKILNENQLTESDWVKSGEAGRIGKLLVADYLVIGHIDRHNYYTKNINIALTGENKTDVMGDFGVRFRVVEVASGKIVFANTILKKLIMNDIPYAERKDMTPEDFRDRMYANVADTCGNAILAGIYPIKVASVTGEVVVLNRGRGAGIKKGDRLKVYSAGETVTDPDTGEVLGVEEAEIGEIEVTSVESKFTKAKIVTAISPFKRGAICRSAVKKEVAPAAGPAYPRVKPEW